MGTFTAEVSENYLKQIYNLALDSSPVKTSRLAEALSLSAAAVTEMIKRLDEQQLVEYQPYRGVTLTEKGQRRALAVIRRHRLWEVFLHQVLKMPWEVVHQHAERLEHATDDTLAGYLDDFMGRPSFDPHGHPIPNEEGEVKEIDRLRLTALQKGDRAEVVQCSNETPDLLDYLKGLGLLPGAHLELVEQAPFNGPLTIRILGAEGDEARVVGTEAARTLFVRRL